MASYFSLLDIEWHILWWFRTTAFANSYLAFSSLLSIMIDTNHNFALVGYSSDEDHGLVKSWSDSFESDDDADGDFLTGQEFNDEIGVFEPIAAVPADEVADRAPMSGIPHHYW